MSVIYNRTNGVTIGSKHSYKKFKGLLKTKKIGTPEPQTVFIEIPGMDGKLDMTEGVYGKEIRYKNRKIEIELRFMDIERTWSSVYSAIMNEWHGKELKVIFDDDKYWYYIGRAKITDIRQIGVAGDIVIEIDADPYKYCCDSMTGDKWKWDELNFINGVIIPNVWLLSSGKNTITFVNPYLPTRPIFNSSVDCKLTYKDAYGDSCKIDLKKDQKITGELIKTGETEMIITTSELGGISIKFEERKSL